MKECLFSAINETEHVYTWDYTTREAAVDLFDVNDECFAMITERREIADETGAMLDYRDNTWYIWHLYSKSEVRPIEELSGFGVKQSFDFPEGKPKEIGKDKLIDKMKKKPWGPGIKKVETIMLSAGRVSVLDGNLTLDRI